jgi:signal transduction histidine kinase
VELNICVANDSLRMHVDASQTRRAVCHLLSALAATPDGGGVNIDAQSITGARLGDAAKRLVVINVADSGAGIPAEEVPFIFDAFWQATDTRSPGRGVGLAIARRIAASHGGNVSVRSQVGSGTVYRLRCRLI